MKIKQNIHDYILVFAIKNLVIFFIYFTINKIECFQNLFHSNRPFPIELKNRDIVFSNYSGKDNKLIKNLKNFKILL